MPSTSAFSTTASHKPKEGYSDEDLYEIRVAERRFFEEIYSSLVISRTLYILFGNNQLGDSESRTKWHMARTHVALNEWRHCFAPSRIGKPLESEWTYHGKP